MSFLTRFAHVLRRDEPLGKYTAARLGGNADWLYSTAHDTPLEQLVDVVAAAWADGLPVRVIGGGANVLISDKGVRGLVVVNRITQVQFGAWHDGRTASASSGTGLLAMARACAKAGYRGFEWAVGVPGTIGGAVVNNAGAHGADIASNVADVVIYEANGGASLLNGAQLGYDYRTSALKRRDDKRFVVLLATFALPQGAPADIQARMEEYNAYRKRTQPHGASLGSVFKNPPNDYAGRLIEACGLKGYRIGTAQVSEKHANFFLNVGDANATDYAALIDHVQACVYARFGVILELEIEKVGEWG